MKPLNNNNPPELDISNLNLYEYPSPPPFVPISPSPNQPLLEELEKMISQRIAQAKYDIIYDVRNQISKIPNLPTLLEHIKKFGILISQIDNRNETKIDSIKTEVLVTLRDFDRRLQDCIDKTQYDIQVLIDRHRRERERMNERMTSLVNEITLLKKQMNTQIKNEDNNLEYNNILSLLERDALEKTRIQEQIGSMNTQIDYINDIVDKLKLNSKCPFSEKLIDYCNEEFGYKLERIRSDLYDVQKKLNMVY
jgi:septum formation inhibitor MinC